MIFCFDEIVGLKKLPHSGEVNFGDLFLGNCDLKKKTYSGVNDGKAEEQIQKQQS